jgi:hypothetical protein
MRRDNEQACLGRDVERRRRRTAAGVLSPRGGNDVDDRRRHCDNERDNR